MNTGIYIITNDKNKKVYIGSTTDFKRRWGVHRRTLRHGTHSNTHLQSAWVAYGETAFKFSILEYINNPEELHLAEQFWMDIYRLEGKELYNYGLAARCPRLGRPRSEETRRRLSEINSGENHPMWGTTPSKETRRRISEAKMGGHHAVETCLKIGKANARPYPAFVHRGTGELIPAGVNLSALCRKHRLDVGCMHHITTSKQTQHKGWELKEQMEQL